MKVTPAGVVDVLVDVVVLNKLLLKRIKNRNKKPISITENILSI
jgi:hypothetical protein